MSAAKWKLKSAPKGNVKALKSASCFAVAASHGVRTLADAAAAVPAVQECAVGNAADASAVARAQTPILTASGPLPGPTVFRAPGLPSHLPPPVSGGDSVAQFYPLRFEV